MTRACNVLHCSRVELVRPSTSKKAHAKIAQHDLVLHRCLSAGDTPTKGLQVTCQPMLCRHRPCTKMIYCLWSGVASRWRASHAHVDACSSRIYHEASKCCLKWRLLVEG